VPVLDVAKLFFRIGEDLGLTSFSRQVAELKVDNRWQAIAREGLLDDIGTQQKAITVAVVNLNDQQGDALAGWMEERRFLIKRWHDALTELNSGSASEFALYSVVLRELVNLAQSEVMV
jgi:glutamate dehydrogenase